ncbi:MAG: SLBB domain-containing protein, partial [Treponema sp.]|nr:SLBB domain-containing protein [Treponema sp.]
MKKTVTTYFLLVVLVGWSATRLHAQTAGASATPALTGLSEHSQLALSTSDYLVTAGDLYTLMYAAGSTAVQYSMTIDSTYKVRVSNLGVIDANGKTFNELKAQVETIVSNNYPLGGVQFVLTQPAVFKVYLRGEVQAASDVQAWALTRLSVLLNAGGASQLTEYSSIRDIQIRSRNGRTKTYDMFRALRNGDMTQDPFVRPDDIITVNRIERMVSIAGAVERPGSYQLLKGEQLEELIMKYANGFTAVADPSRMELVRYVHSVSQSGNKIDLSEADIRDNYVLEHFDRINVPNITTLRPVLFVEGAAHIQSDAASASVLQTSSRLSIAFNEGETYGGLVRSNISWFSASSDTQNAYIIRGNTQISINLNPLLYDVTNRNDTLILANDRLIIPFRQYFVSVAGAVVMPGRYPYIPDRSWEYYIGLAGGFVQEKNSGDKIVITDIAGKTRDKSDPITPETLITATSNKWTYSFNQIAPIITTSLSIVSTFIS